VCYGRAIGLSAMHSGFWCVLVLFDAGMHVNVYGDLVYTLVEGGNGNDFIVIFVLQTFAPCLPTVKKWFKNATATSTE
jgi:hypothetical protein